jgi:O-antigen ligase
MRSLKKSVFPPAERWRGAYREAALQGVIAALAFAPVTFVTLETSPTAWAPAAAVCAAVFVATGNLRPSGRLLLPALILLGIAGLTAISAFWAIAPERPLVATRDLLGYAVAALILIQSIEGFSPAQRGRALDLLVVGVWLAVVVLIARELYFACCSAPADLTAHVRTLHKITFYGATLVALLLTQEDIISLSLAVAVAFTTLILGRSAGIDVALVVVFVFRMVSDRSRQRMLMTFITCYIVAAVFAPLMISAAFTFLDSHGLLAFYTGTFAARLELWAAIAGHVHGAPILGHGANTTRNAVDLALQGKYYTLPDLPSAHNIIFDLWFELGIVGIGVYALVLAALAQLIGRLRGLSHFLASSCLVVAVIELSVDHRIWLSWVLGALTMTAVICILQCRCSVPRPSALALGSNTATHGAC